MECSNFGCAVLGNKVYVVGGALVDDRGCSAGEFPETVHPFGFAFDPISEVGLLAKVLKIINPTHCTRGIEVNTQIVYGNHLQFSTLL